MKATHREKWSNIFYWIGVVAAFLTVALVFIGHSKWGSSLERTGFPIAWKLAIVSILAFLAREICRPPRSQHELNRDNRHSIDHIPHEI
jgi:hypothetical protein